jgi:hypothetical protein
MAYIGNQVIPVPFLVNIFSGNATATNFGPLSRAPAGPASIIVFISGVYKVPGVDYTIDANYIYFATPPASAVNNIVVHHLGNGFMATQVPADGTVTGGKLTGNSIRGNNIVAGTITGNLIADTAIASNNIVVRAITGNLIGIGAITGNNFAQPITGNMIGSYAISGNQISTGAISGNQMGLYAISGNNIGIGAVSANNFAGGGITSNVLASNLSISVSRVTETININTAVIGSNSASGTNVNLDIVNTTVYYFSSNTTGNVTFNLRGNNINTFDSAVQVGNTVSVVVTLRHNTAAYRSGVNVMIDGGLIKTTLSTPDTGNLIMYAGNTLPAHATINAIESNIIGLNIIKKAANSYIVYMSNTLFGLT